MLRSASGSQCESCHLHGSGCEWLLRVKGLGFRVSSGSHECAGRGAPQDRDGRPGGPWAPGCGSCRAAGAAAHGNQGCRQGGAVHVARRRFAGCSAARGGGAQRRRCSDGLGGAGAARCGCLGGELSVWGLGLALLLRRVAVLGFGVGLAAASVFGAALPSRCRDGVATASRFITETNRMRCWSY
jgi:hypothetical protein